MNVILLICYVPFNLCVLWIKSASCKFHCSFLFPFNIIGSEFSFPAHTYFLWRHRSRKSLQIIEKKKKNRKKKRKTKRKMFGLWNFVCFQSQFYIDLFCFVALYSLSLSLGSTNGVTFYASTSYLITTQFVHFVRFVRFDFHCTYDYAITTHVTTVRVRLFERFLDFSVAAASFRLCLFHICDWHKHSFVRCTSDSQHQPNHCRICRYFFFFHDIFSCANSKFFICCWSTTPLLHSYYYAYEIIIMIIYI